eukprot:COSAG02_NODE_1394_length_12906_cov_3.129304_8_plen_185_part_00
MGSTGIRRSVLAKLPLRSTSTKRWPTLFVMSEAKTVDSISLHPNFPWYSHDNKLTPTLEPDNSEIARLILPGSTAYEVPIGGGKFFRHTLRSPPNANGADSINVESNPSYATFELSRAGGHFGELANNLADRFRPSVIPLELCKWSSCVVWFLQTTHSLSHQNVADRGTKYPLLNPAAQAACQF